MNDWSREAVMQRAVDQAVLEADRLLVSVALNSDELNYLTARVALRFVEKCLIAVQHELNKRNLGLKEGGGS